MDPSARETIEALQAAVEDLLQDPSSDRLVLATAVGRLGQHFHAFRLLDAALECYGDAGGLAPEDRRWAYYRGVILHQQGLFEAAVEDFQRALELGSRDVPTLVRLGNAQIELDRLDAARESFTAALELDEVSAPAFAGLGTVAQLEGDFEAARGALERALEIQPGATALNYPLAQVYRRLGSVEAATRQLVKQGEGEALLADPLLDEISVLSQTTAFAIVQSMAAGEEEGEFSERDYLGFVLSRLGELRGAIDQLERRLELRERSGSASATELARLHYAVGGLQVYKDLPEEASGHLARAVELAPSLRDAKVQLGNLQAREGRFEAAAAIYAEALALDRDDSETLLRRGVVLAQAGELPAARSDLEASLELEPTNADARLRLASVMMGQGDSEAAEGQLRLAIAGGGTATERARAHAMLGGLLRQRGDAVAAVAEYERALDEDSAHIAALEALANTLLQIGESERARERYENLVGLDPRSESARIGEATALILVGRHRQALERLDVALEAVPESVVLKNLLARHLAACPDRSIRDGARAVALASEVTAELESPVTVETLAMAFAEAGSFGQAVDTQQRLIDRYSSSAPDGAEPRWRAILALYVNEKSCCGESPGP